ncbi:cytochrome P450, partial [Gautieria morchelliformis]
TASVLATFFLMMTLHPEAQAKAQAEIDALLARQHLPTMHDQKYVPCIEALIKEIYCFHPVAPLVIHSPLEDDVSQGYLIPKGSSVFTNIWAILHNEKTFPEPHRFIPERFAPTDPGHKLPLDPRSVIFGFVCLDHTGSICPGQHLGDTSVFLAISTCLATLHITKQVDDRGAEVDLIIDFTSGHTS